MKYEASPQDEQFASELYDRVAGHRSELMNRTEQREGLDALAETAAINLESYGRAYLDLSKGLPRAIELLGQANALRKPDIQAAIADHLERLGRSATEDDQKQLIEISEKLLSFFRRSAASSATAATQ